MYTSGAHWNLTYIDGITVKWVNVGPSRPDQGGIGAILDPSSTEPARRVMRDDGTVYSLEGESPGLVVFGTHIADRPHPDRVAELEPAYAAIMGEFVRGAGVTHHRFTSGGDPLLNVREAAARIGVQPRTISRYRMRGEFPLPDEVVSGRPRWRGSTLDSWVQTRPGWEHARTTSAW